MTREIRDKIVLKLQKWFDHNGPAGKAVVGISGGKDSSVVAALCVKALGRNRVVGVLMPNGVQSDIEDSMKLCRHLKIEPTIVNIAPAYEYLNEEVVRQLRASGVSTNGCDQTRRTQNLPPRLRMATLYAVAQSVDGRVIGTGNAAEGYVGYCTWGGDNIADFNPLANMFVDEVIELGKLLDLPIDLVEKTPSDGLCGRSDEANLGFSYASVKLAALKKPGDWMHKIAAIEKESGPEALDGRLYGLAVQAIEMRHDISQFKRDAFNVPSIKFYRTNYSGEIYDVV